MRDDRTAAGTRPRRRALAVVARGPGAVAGLLAAVALGTGLAGLALLAGSAPGREPQANAIARWCLVALAAAGGVALAATAAGALWRRRRGPALAAERPRHDLTTAVLLAACGLLPALLIPVHYLAARTHPSSVHWISFGFLDKRWLTSLFLIVVAGSALLLVVAARIVAAAHAGAEDDGAPPPAGAADAERQSRRAVALKLLCAVLVAAYFFAPPWHLPPTSLGYHETQTMAGVQAIATGSLPYVDAAAIQYGPGTELANYAFTQATGQMSADGLRHTSLLLTWIAATIFLGVVYVRARPLAALMTTVAAVAFFPAFQLFRITADGHVDGFWGWANLLRYAGVFMLAMLFPAIVRRPERRVVKAVALGAAWGLLCWIAQENLIGGILVLGVLAVLLVASRTATWRPVAATLAGVAGGFLAVVVPICAYYVAHGRLGRALELYWLVPQAVASGYSNTNWTSHKYTALFYGLPVLLAVLLIAALLAPRPLRVATAWCDRRVVLVSALVAAVICHLGALTRSDGPHLANTELALPAALCLAAFSLPALLGVRSRPGRALGGAAIVVAALALLPLAPYSSAPARIGGRLWRPAMARVNPPAQRPLPAGIPAHSLAAARIGPTTLRQRRCCSNRHPVDMATFVRFLDRLHAIVGNRRVFVDDTPSLSPGAITFLADLRPAPTREDYGTMVVSTAAREQWLRQFRARLPEIEAVVTRNRSHAPPALWLAANPKYRVVTLPYGPRLKAYVLLR